jgi:hypothetical protein
MTDKTYSAEGIENPYWHWVQMHRMEPDFRGQLAVERWSEESTLWLRHNLYGPRRPTREDLTVEYAWAITSPEALEFVACYSGGRLVEIGAGTGYWAWCLTQMGVDVIAYDKDPPDKKKNWYHARWREDDEKIDPRRPVYHWVRHGQVSAVMGHADRTLLLCWPPHADPFAERALSLYDGDRLIFIGEGDGGCTGTREFFAALESKWEEVAQHDMVVWDGIHDTVTVYDRRK